MGPETTIFQDLTPMSPRSSPRKTTAADYPSEIFDFFTLRNMWWGYYEWGAEHEHGPGRFVGTEDNWSFGYSMDDERRAGQIDPEILKRMEASYEPPTPDEYDMPKEAYVPWLGKKVGHPEGYGIYFQDRWEDALAVDPPFI